MTTPTTAEGEALLGRYRDSLGFMSEDSSLNNPHVADYAERIAAIEAAARAEAVKEFDHRTMTHAWAILTAETNPDHWEPDRYNAAAFVAALLDKYRALLATTPPAKPDDSDYEANVRKVQNPYD